MMASPSGWSRLQPIAIAVLFLMSAMAPAACSSGPTASGALGPGSVIDHYSLGDPIDCGDYRDPTCDDYLRVATDTATEQRGVVPAATVGHHFYSESVPGTSKGSSTVVVVVFDLADGAHVAVGVYCGVGPCHVVGR